MILLEKGCCESGIKLSWQKIIFFSLSRPKEEMGTVTPIKQRKMQVNKMHCSRHLLQLRLIFPPAVLPNVHTKCVTAVPIVFFFLYLTHSADFVAWKIFLVHVRTFSDKKCTKEHWLCGCLMILCFFLLTSMQACSSKNYTESKVTSDYLTHNQ